MSEAHRWLAHHPEHCDWTVVLQRVRGWRDASAIQTGELVYLVHAFGNDQALAALAADDALYRAPGPRFGGGSHYPIMANVALIGLASRRETLIATAPADTALLPILRALSKVPFVTDPSNRMHLGIWGVLPKWRRALSPEQRSEVVQLATRLAARARGRKRVGANRGVHEGSSRFARRHSTQRKRRRGRASKAAARAQRKTQEVVMAEESVISPAFEPFLAESGGRDKREAIVIFRPPEGTLPVRGRLRKLQEKLRLVADQAKAEASVRTALIAGYRKEGAKHLNLKGSPAPKVTLSAGPIGAGGLPVAVFEVTRKTLPELGRRPDVVAVLPNQKIRLIRPKAVEYSALARQEAKDGLTWGLKQLDIPKLWQTTKGKDIQVAVLDTGVHAEHPALDGRVKGFLVVDPLGRRIEANPAFDSDQHGTHVCGTIAGGKAGGKVSIGVAPECNLFVAGVLVGDATVRTLMEGISWAVEKGADVVSMSLGFSYYEPLFAQVFDLLLKRSVLPVVAIGNENHGNTSSPGNAYNAFSVGAAEKVAGGKVDVAPFSSGASLSFPGDEPNALVTKPEVVAPGVQVFSCIPPQKRPEGAVEYTYMDGTSMATPHVAGVAVLLMAAKPSAPVEHVIDALKKTAHHPGGESRRPDNRWGYGMIRPLEALKAL